MSSDRAPPERPEQPDQTDSDASSDEIDATSDTDRGLAGINTTPGERRTRSVEMLKIEAQLVADGHEPDNPALPVTAEVAETFHENYIDGTDLVPAWERPWEDDDADGGGGDV